MRFIELKFKNWISYYGDHSIAFSTSKTKPFTVIRGESEGGKSAVLRAFRWCLYGNTADKEKYKTPDLILNREAKRKNEGVFEVSLAVEKDDQKIYITRSCKVKKGKKIDKDTFEDQDLNFTIDGKAYTGVKAQNNILSLIHENISRFYLFDGEMLGDYAELIHGGSNYDEIKDSIEDILMLPILQNAKNALSTLSSQKLLAANKGSKANDSAKDARTKLEQVKQELNAKLDEKQDLKDKKSEYQTKLNDLDKEEEKLISDNDLEEFKEANNVIEGSDDIINSYEEEILENTADLWLTVLGKKIDPLKKKIKKRKDFLEKYQKNYTLLDVLRELHEDSSISKESRKVIDKKISKLSSLKGKNIDDENYEIKKIEDVFSSIVNSINRLPQLSSSYEKWKEAKLKLINAKNTVKKLKKKGLAKSSADKKDEIKTERSKLNRFIGQIDVQLKKDSQLEKAINKLTLKQDTLRKKSKATVDDSIPAQEYQVTDFLHNLFDSSLNKATTDMKTKVDISSNKIYAELRKYRFTEFTSTNKLIINDDYGLEVVDENDEFIETSEGGSQICAITLITALKQNINHNAPLMMDSPFMRIDDQYRQALVELYMDKSDQTILLVSPTELPELSELDKKLRDMSGKRYEISRLSDVQSEILPI